MSEEDWSNELRLIECRGFTLDPGLTQEELSRVERMHGFRFPSDLRSFLASAIPVSKPGGFRFPDWRDPNSAALIDKLSWPFDGIAYDIENNAFWWEPWGMRPATLAEALAVARAAVERAPKLIPVLGHRYLPAEPLLAGNPVFSAYQTDIIYYGSDLRRYLACEFGAIDHAEAVRGERRRIPFWSDLVDNNG